MENHPIPQDVTGFQFKLIGNMTVKQFAYLATGCIFAIILYYAPVFLLLKLFFIPLFAGSGAALAFLPIDGRPLDVMVSQLIKALVSPNQYVYRKVGTHFAFTDFSISTHVSPSTSPKPEKKKQEEEKKQAFVTYLSSTATQKQSTMDQRESAFLQHLFNPQTPIAQPLTSMTQPPPAIDRVVSSIQTVPQVSSPQPESLEEKDKVIIDTVTKMQQELNKAKAEESQAQASQTAVAHDHTMSLEHQLQELLKQKEQLEQELQKLQQTATNHAATHPTDTYTVEEIKPPDPAATAVDRAEEAHVKKLMTPQEAKSRGILSPSDSPNVLMGVVHDPRGNILSNILVELTDKEGTPVRAFKTNQLGQFASATALPNGVYLLTLEDPKSTARFDTIEIITSGNILPPLDITSHDEREELRKALFN
jgi:hypothetical protein